MEKSHIYCYNDCIAGNLTVKMKKYAHIGIAGKHRNRAKDKK